MGPSWHWDDGTGTAGQWLLNLSGVAKPWTRERILEASTLFGVAIINGVWWSHWDGKWVPRELVRD